MARIRSVKPGICQSETIARLSAEVERTFVRLWTHCDDHGRCLDNTKLITAALFPLLDEMTADVVDEHLNVLWGEGLVRRYEVDGRRYLCIPSWSEHQHPQRAADSDIPEPEGDDPGPVPAPSMTTRGSVAEDARPVVVEVEVVGEVGERKPSAALVPAPASSAAPRANGYSSDFEAFWLACPRKVGKGAAAAAFSKARRRASTATLIGAMQAHALGWQRARTETQFIPHPSKWLNDQRYDDPPPTADESPLRTRADQNLATLDRSLEEMQRRNGTA